MLLKLSLLFVALVSIAAGGARTPLVPARHRVVSWGSSFVGDVFSQDPRAIAAVPVVSRSSMSRMSRNPRVPSNNHCPRSLDQIALDENGGSYVGKNPRSTASGRYQVLDSTWSNYGGFRHAQDAPPAVQEAQAHELYAMKGSQPWSSSGC